MNAGLVLGSERVMVLSQRDRPSFSLRKMSVEEESINKLRDYVAKSGLKSSRQRELIAEVFFTTGGHIKIEELLAKVRDSDPKVGQATIYRTMKLLVECGLALVHQFGDGHARYEPVTTSHSHHDHIICNDCGHIQEFLNEDLERIQDEIAAVHKFTLTSHKMELYGNCLREDCDYRKANAS